MKILGIVCSPRVHGNTETLVAAALAKAQQQGAEIELVTVAGKTIAPCDSCLSCVKTGKCHIKDDMQPIYPKLLEADGIIFGSPVYYWSVSAQAKALIDRTYVYRTKRDLKNKAAGAVVALASSGDAGAVTDLNNFFIIQKMVIVGRAMGIGRDKAEVRNDIKGMTQAEDLGEVMVNYLKSGKISLLPEQSYKVETRLREVQ
jgi:multimeric flavodoxin WrbA